MDFELFIIFTYFQIRVKFSEFLLSPLAVSKYKLGNPAHVHTVPRSDRGRVSCIVSSRGFKRKKEREIIVECGDFVAKVWQSRPVQPHSEQGRISARGKRRKASLFTQWRSQNSGLGRRRELSC